MDRMKKLIEKLSHEFASARWHELLEDYNKWNYNQDKYQKFYEMFINDRLWGHITIYNLNNVAWFTGSGHMAYFRQDKKTDKIHLVCGNDKSEYFYPRIEEIVEEINAADPEIEELSKDLNSALEELND